MAKHPIEDDLKAARAAIRHASDARAFHRRRTSRGSQQREADLKEAMDRVHKAMKPLRSYLGRAPYATQSHSHSDFVERVREVSASLQAERRKLWKMQDRRKKTTKRAPHVRSEPVSNGSNGDKTYSTNQVRSDAALEQTTGQQR